jgi:trk system potassium uptake protein TrkH
LGSLFITLTGIDFITAIGGCATTLGNVGPAIGKLGPVDNYRMGSGYSQVDFFSADVIGKVRTISQS